MITIRVEVSPDGHVKWSPVASERDGGWCIVQDGNRLVCAIGDALDGESVSAFVPDGPYVAEWRIDGFAHEIWIDGLLGGRLIETREFERGALLHIGSDPWHPLRQYPGEVSVEVIDG